MSLTEQADVEAVLRGRAGAGRAASSTRTSGERGQRALSLCARAWHGPRSELFEQAARGCEATAVLAQQSCQAAEAVLADLGTVVRRTHDDLAHLAARRRALHAPIATLIGVPAGLPDPAVEAARRVSVLDAEAAAYVDELRRVEARSAGELDTLTDRVGPHLSTLDPGAIARRVSGGSPGTGAAGALTSLTGALLVASGASPTTAPPPGSSPDTVRRWWTALPAALRDLLLRADPRRFGNLDGIPALDRDLANRVVLPQEISSVRAELAARFPHGEPPRARVVSAGYAGRPLTLPNPDWDVWDSLHQRLDGALAIATRVAGGAAYLLLAFAPRVGHGHAVVARGNPDTARHVSVYVPGATDRLGSIGADMDRSGRIRASALRAGAEDASLCTITWCGYDAPPSVVPDAAHLGWADKGAPALDRFTSGLRATHLGDRRAHTTVVAHSYGTTLAGRAASHGHRLDVDDVVLVASPGVGVGNGWRGDDDESTVDDLRLTGSSRGHVYAIRSQADLIRLATSTHLGVDPTRPGFGATPIGADFWDGHDDYWDDPHDPALVGMGRVIAGVGSTAPAPTPVETLHLPRVRPVGPTVRLP